RTRVLGGGRGELFGRLAAAFEHAARLGDTVLLHGTIREPVVVVTAHGGWLPGVLAQAVDDRDGRFVGLDGLIPHAEGQEDMGRHVLRMPSVRRNRGIEACCTQAERRVDRVIVTMNQGWWSK